MSYAIEKNVPSAGFHGRSKYPWALMEIGDSFFVPDEALSKVSSAAQKYKRRTGKTMTCRTVDGGVRVWRSA